MKPFQWDPNSNMVFTSDMGSQVLTSGNYDLQNNASFILDAAYETLFLRGATSLDWSESSKFNEIRSGALDITFSKHNDSYSFGKMRIGHSENEATLSLFITSEGEQEFLGKDIDIGPLGKINITSNSSNPSIHVEESITLTGKSSCNILTSDTQNGRVFINTEFRLQDISRLTIDTNEAHEPKLNICDSSSVIISTNTFTPFPYENTIKISGGGYLYIGPRHENELKFPVQAPGMFNIISINSDSPAIALKGTVGDSGTSVDSAYGKAWLKQNNIIFVDGEPDTKNKLKYDYTSQQGLMLVTL
ncbi:hypothetical protein [Serratia marcescens]|uniref:hypothetical protein n=1 Tax=Serratia marcescens TaxID=615 RepID=UPI001249BF57|nr:hypothetical protein [Serratia marcescens]KAB1581174.1 hypothetical protein F7687_08040 [Serratia marcescens]